MSNIDLAQPPVLGSLTLGGFDSARITAGRNLTSALQANDNSVVVGIGAITLANALAPITTLQSIENNFTALIDTTFPYTYLPTYVCQQLEQAFGLQWDAAHEMYLISDTTHQQLLKNKPSIMFTLSASLPQPTALNITVPYAAFDLTAAYPIFPNGTNYFPLRRANSSAQLILGRGFMQEAYLFVDYEMSQFTITQAAFPASGSQNIVTMDHSAAAGSASSLNSNGLSVGAIAGIAVGSSIGIVLFCTLVWVSMRARNAKRQRRREDGVWRAPVTKGPFASTGSSSGPEKSILSSTASRYSSTPAFRAYRLDQTRSRAPSDYQRMSRSTSTQSPLSSAGKYKAPWRSSGHSRISSRSSKDLRSVRISHPSSPMHNGKAMLDLDDPWQTNVLDPPTNAKKATPPTGHTRMFSILDEKDPDDEPLPRASSAKRAGLPKLNTTQEMYRAPKEWETPKEWDTMDVGWSPSPISPARPQHSSRPSYSKTRQNSLNTIIVDSEPTAHGSKPSVSSEASKIRQKHIWEMQSPGRSPGSSRGASPSRHRSKMSAGGGYQPSIPEIPGSPTSQVPTPTVSPGPDSRRRHIWELQNPGGSRGSSRKHSRTEMRDLTKDVTGDTTGDVTKDAQDLGGNENAAAGYIPDHGSAMPGTAI